MKIKNYIDNSYYVIFGTYFAICFVLSLILIIFHSNLGFAILGVFFAGLIALLTYFFYYRSYAFTDKAMIVKIGFLTKEYFYKDMQKCFITENNCISYATSYKRICIELKNGNKIYISPIKMDEILFTLLNKTEVKKEEPVKKTIREKEVTKKIEKKPSTKKSATKAKTVVKKSNTKSTSVKTVAKKTTVKKERTKKTGDQNK